jgi:hypothetical protein
MYSDLDRRAELQAAEVFLHSVRRSHYITGCPHCESESVANGRRSIEAWGQTITPYKGVK